mgnify:CR=1 FL=1
MKEIGTRDLILHGPFLDVNPCAYDSMVREATMTRFNQCYEAGLHLGAKKIVFHSGMKPVCLTTKNIGRSRLPNSGRNL